MESFILDALDSIGKFDFAMLGRIIAYSYIGLWVLIALWVWFDSGERTKAYFFRVLSVIVVFFGQILGLFLYFILRSKSTLTEQYWADLEKRFLLYETSELGDCPNCGDHLMPGFNNCPNCNYTLKVKCPGCEVMLDKDWNYCPYCSTEIAGVYPDKATLVKEIRAENRQKQKETDKAVAQKFNMVKSSVGGYLNKVKQKAAKSNSSKEVSKNENVETPSTLKEDRSLKVEDSSASVSSSSATYVKQAPVRTKRRKDVGFLEFLGILGSKVLAPFKPKAKAEREISKSTKSSDSVESNVESKATDTKNDRPKSSSPKQTKRDRRKKKRRNR